MILFRGLMRTSRSLWIFYHILFNVTENTTSFDLDHLNDAIYGSLAKRTRRIDRQLLITKLTNCIMPTRLEYDCSDINVAKGTVTVVSLVLTSLLLLVILLSLLLDSPFLDSFDNFSGDFDSSYSQENYQQKSYQTKTIILFPEFW